MRRFEVLADAGPVGWSELEGGDPPMGTAHGVLHPGEAYALMPPGATVRVRAPDGVYLEPSGGVWIEDYAAELGPEGRVIHVLGLDAEVYEAYFPELCRQYRGRDVASGEESAPS